MRFSLIVAALIGAVAAAPQNDVRASTSSTCTPAGGLAGKTICDDPAYTGNKLKLNNQAFNLGGCAASLQAKILCEARDN